MYPYLGPYMTGMMIKPLYIVNPLIFITANYKLFITHYALIIVLSPL